jgi:hypothetical protein
VTDFGRWGWVKCLSERLGSGGSSGSSRCMGQRLIQGRRRTAERCGNGLGKPSRTYSPTEFKICEGSRRWRNPRRCGGSVGRSANTRLLTCYRCLFQTLRGGTARYFTLDRPRPDGYGCRPVAYANGAARPFGARHQAQNHTLGITMSTGADTPALSGDVVFTSMSRTRFSGHTGPGVI